MLVNKPFGKEAFTLEDTPGIGVIFKKADGIKCERCWKILEEVKSDSKTCLCERCNVAII